MQSLIRSFLISAVVLLCAVHAGCGWQKQLEFPGPDRSSLIIRQPWPANGWGLQLQLCQKGSCEVVYSLRGDVFLGFADVYWSNDGILVGVVTSAEPNLRFAYDRVRKMEVPFAGLADPMRGHIRQVYLLDSTVDPLRWISSDDASLRFAKAHPGFQQR